MQAKGGAFRIGGILTHKHRRFADVANHQLTISASQWLALHKAIIYRPSPSMCRTVLHAKMVNEHPGFTEYQEKTKRVIPVVTLSRLS